MPVDKKPPNRDAGAAGAFAYALYELWVAAGSRPLREMGKKAALSHSSLSRAMSGRQVPTWEVTRAFVDACTVVPPEHRQHQDWLARWEAAKAQEAQEKATAAQQITRKPAATPTGKPARTGAGKPEQKAEEKDTAVGARPTSAPPLDPRPVDGVSVRVDAGASASRLWLPIRDGIAEHLPTDVLLKAVKTAQKSAQEAAQGPGCASTAGPEVAGETALDALARTIGCDVATTADYLIHSVIALRTQTTRLRRRLAAAIPPSPFFPAHLLPYPDVRLVPAATGQLAVVGKSVRSPGAHQRPPSDPRRRQPHEHGPGATVSTLHTPPLPLSPAPADALSAPVVTDATGTDNVGLAPPSTTSKPRPGAHPTPAGSPASGPGGTASTAEPAPDRPHGVPPLTATAGGGRHGSSTAPRGLLLFRNRLCIQMTALWFVTVAACVVLFVKHLA